MGNIDRTACSPFPVECFSPVFRCHPGPKTALAVPFDFADTMIFHRYSSYKFFFLDVLYTICIKMHNSPVIVFIGNKYPNSLKCLTLAARGLNIYDF